MLETELRETALRFTHNWKDDDVFNTTLSVQKVEDGIIDFTLSENTVYLTEDGEKEDEFSRESFITLDRSQIKTLIAFLQSQLEN